MKRLHSKQYAGTRHICNPDREYVHSTKTDIRVTLDRVRAELATDTKKQPKVRRIR